MFISLSFDKEVKQNAVKVRFDFSIFTPFVIVLIIAYFTEGVGFVVQATFLPDIINNLEGCDWSWRNYTWTLGWSCWISFLALFGCFLAHRFGA